MTEAETQTQEPNIDREEWFLAQLDLPQIPTEPLLEFLVALRGEGQVDQAATWTDLLLEALMERGEARSAVEVITERVTAAGDGAAGLSACRKDVRNALEKSGDQRVLADQVGFDKNLAPAECMRRLGLLMDMQKGRLCYDKTWGFGIIRRVDYFYKRVEIDFDKKADHHMSMEYAAETLTLLGKEHLLARKHDDPEELARMIREDAAEVVRLSLRSYGPMSVLTLQETLVPSVIAESDWKRFWEAARKGLRNDPLVDIPRRRSEPIRLLAKEKAYDHEWFERLATQRNLDRIIALIEELAADDNAREIAAEHGGVMVNRLRFVIRGAHPRWPGLIARALMVGRILGVDEDALDTKVYAEELMQAEAVQETARQLPAKYLGPFLRFLLDRDEERILTQAAELLPELELGLLNETVALLLERGQEAKVAGTMRRLVADLKAGVEVMTWILRNPERIKDWGLGGLTELANLALAAIEEDHGGERLRAQNQLRERFARDEWFGPALDAMTDSQRRDFMHRLKDTPGYPTMDRRSLLGKAIKRHPDLEDVMRSRPSTDQEKTRPRVTSTRSFRARQEQLSRLIKVEIPQNSKEIAVARSYGDLRENHEYKAAKEMQGILLRRQGELEQMLTEVKPTDFLNEPFDVVGPATGVDLIYSDGHQERFYILGEWDRDEDLHIISSTTRMAQALEGHASGDEVVVPTEDGETTCTLANVTGLPDTIRAWLDSEEGAQAS